MEKTAEGEDEREGESLAGSGPLKYSCVRSGGVLDTARREKHGETRARVAPCRGETRKRGRKREKESLPD